MYNINCNCFFFFVMEITADGFWNLLMFLFSFVSSSLFLFVLSLVITFSLSQSPMPWMPVFSPWAIGGLSLQVGHLAQSWPSPWTPQPQPSCPTLSQPPSLLLLVLLFLLPSGPHRPIWTPSQPSPSMRGKGRLRGPWTWTLSLFTLLHRGT